MFYSVNIFKGFPAEGTIVSEEVENTATIFNVVTNILNVVSAVTAGLVVGKAGRKTILMIGTLLCMIFLGVLAYLVYDNNSSLSRWFVLFYVFSFGMSLGPIVWIYMAEVLPDIGMAVATFVNWIFTLTIGLGFPIVRKPEVLNSYGVFMLFSGCCLAGLILIVTLVKET